ncbi:MAG: putative CtpA-like serine protease [SAR116 cluster bacterium MED-G04]|jgi:carboxyl-terminal processing protease|nr:MAG: putative CtpA-like serine protease [SAR116 cluster bacterium MED-G04]
MLHQSVWIRKILVLSIRAFAVFGLAVFGFALATILIPTASISQSSSNEETYRQLTLFGDVFQRVREDYVEEMSEEDLISNAIKGMLTSLDPHSNYLPSEAFDKMKVRTKGEFGGLGIEITMEDGLVKVVSPIDETPADIAGIEAGDLIIQIGEEEVLGLTLAEAVELMRGPVGTDLDITILREGNEPFTVTITRDTIKMRAVRFESYDNVGYIRLTTFSEQTTPGLIKAIDDLKDEHGDKLSGIILDLRNNPGGLLSEAISVADTFLDKGEIVSTRGRHEDETSRYYASSGDEVDGMPIVVLINSGSASASEIVAGALKDHHRALVMGTRSFGKGSVQSIIPLPGHGAMRLTTARYFTPSGVSIQATGIEPDIMVELAVVEDIENGAVREEDLRGALDNAEDGEDSASDDDSASINIEDYQLARAIDLLQGLSVFNRIVE